MTYFPSRTFPDAAQEAGIWIRDLSELLCCEQPAAYDLLCEALHLVRDSLSVNDNAEIGNGLPVVLRGLYFDDWKPSAAGAPNELGLTHLPRCLQADTGFLVNILKLLENRMGERQPEKLVHALRVWASPLGRVDEGDPLAPLEGPRSTTEKCGPCNRDQAKVRI